MAIAIWSLTRRSDVTSGLEKITALIAAITTAQLVLGVITLVIAVPIAIAVIHQAVGLILFGLAITLVTAARSDGSELQ